MPVCAVADCKSQYGKCDYVFHSFPRIDSLKKTWIALCKRKDGVNSKNPVICSRHFKETDYERDLQHELLNLPLRKRKFLKAEAIPSLFLPLRPPILGLNVERQERSQRRISRKIVEETLKGNLISNLFITAS